MIIVLILVVSGLYLLYQGFKEKIGSGCLALIVVVLIVVLVFLVIAVKSLTA